MHTTLPRPRLLAGLLAATVGVGATGWMLTRHDETPVNVAGSTTVAAPIHTPVVSPLGVTAGRVAWDRSLTLVVTDGVLKEVTALGPDGQLVDGQLSGTGWSSTSDLLPASTYRLVATVLDQAGASRAVVVNTRTSFAAKTLHARLSPGDGKVVGVGQPVIATLDRAVTDGADRTAVVSRLTVTSTPAVAGAWRWMSPTELHYRGPAYWARGTRITATADLTRLKLSDGTWGEGTRATSYSIGAALIATVDVNAKTMTVVRDGKVLRVLKVSTGRDEFPTKGGPHLVLEKVKLKTMDSATIGIPRKSPGGYYLKVPNSVRISYSGEFVHSAPGTVRQQGVANVSHGCVNLSPADAAWFFDLAKRGDVVDVKNAKAKPRLSDPGMADWNVPFSRWAN